MILSSILCLAALQFPQDGAVQRELSLHEIADLIDPFAVARLDGAQDFWRSNLVLSFATPEIDVESSGTDNPLPPSLLESLVSDSVGEAYVRNTISEMVLLESLFAAHQPERSYPFDSNDQFLQTLTTFMDPPFANSGASLKIKTVDGSPVLLGYLDQAQEDWLREFLRIQREERDWAGLVKVQILRGEVIEGVGGAALERLTLLGGQEEIEDAGKRYVVLGMETISAPAMTVLPWQEGKLSVLNQIAYISSWTLQTIEPGHQRIADPEVQTLEEGLELSLRVWQLDMNGFGIEVAIDYSEIDRPIRTTQLSMGVGNDMLDLEVSAPELLTTSVEASVRMPDGSGLQLFAPSEEPGMDVIILLTFHQVDIEAED